MTDSYHRKRVLVTGGSGFMGSHLVESLLVRGAKVFVPHRGQDVPWRFREFTQAPELTPSIDIVNREMVQHSFSTARPDIVFHLAAYGVPAEERNSTLAIQINVLGSTNVAEACLHHDVRRLVHVGSGFEYAGSNLPVAEEDPLQPDTIYGATKTAGWILLDYYHRLHGLPLVTVRPFSLYGPREIETRLVPHVILSALHRKPVKLTEGTQRRDYLYIKDAVAALLEAGSMPRIEGEIINIGTGEPFTVTEIGRKILKIMGNPVSLELGAVASKRYNRHVFCANPSWANLNLGWNPKYSLKEGLQETIAWYRSKEGI